jgi:hypothetical protein
MSREQCLPPQAGGATGREYRQEPTPSHLKNRERIGGDA